LTDRSDVARAGALYAAAGFGTGFLLGVVREFWWAPRHDASIFLAIEAPIILGVCFWLGRKLTAHYGIGPGRDRLAMGGLALLLLMLAELGLLLFTGRAPRDWIASWGTPPGLFGLAGQILFALLPWLDGLGLMKKGS
jgi:hypothetical protein